MDSFDKIVEMIENKTSINRTEILERINKKYEELSGLITKEGAAYLVARELDVPLPTAIHRLQMKNIVPGMSNVNVIGRVFSISKVNEFERSDGSKGKVVNVFIGDETGYIRLPLWNDQVKLVEEGNLNLGDVVQIVNGLARENIFGDIEISLGKYGSIRSVDAEMPSIEELSKKFLTIVPERIFIKDIVPGRFEIKATIVQTFKGKYLFETCPICGITITNKTCPEHGKVEPEVAVVISVVLDDGTGTLRAVFFRELAEKLIGLSASELKELSLEDRFKTLKEKILGRELIVTGRIRKNKRFDRLEILVDDFKDLNVLEESKKLVASLSERVEHA